MSDAPDFLAEDYRFTADLLRRYAFGTGQDTALFRAVCSNNLNIILAALDKASADREIPAALSEGDEEEAR